VIIDAHSHALHGKYLEPLSLTGGEWIKTKIEDLTRLKPQVFDIPLRLEWLDKYSIDLQVITMHHTLDSNLYPADSDAKIKLAEAINNNMARIMEDSKGRMLPVASIPIDNFEQYGIKELERAINTLGLKGVSLPSNLNGKPLDLPEYESFWAWSEKMDIPVFIHPNEPAAHNDRSYEADYSLVIGLGWPFEIMLALCRIVFSGLLDRYPKLKIVTHMGGGIPFYWGRLNETYDPAEQLRTIGKKLSRPLKDYFGSFYYDIALGGNPAAIKCACEIFGTEQIVFAIDSPWGPEKGEFRFREYVNVVKSLNLSNEDKQKIFCDNAKKLIHL
jgi:uncharacterized protein